MPKIDIDVSEQTARIVKRIRQGDLDDIDVSALVVAELEMARWRADKVGIAVDDGPMYDIAKAIAYGDWSSHNRLLDATMQTVLNDWGLTQEGGRPWRHTRTPSA
jgi:hypothetical protein